MPTAAEYRARAQALVDSELGDSPLNGVVMRMLTQESGNFSPDVVEGRRKSSAGAIGIAQFMPRTAANLGVDPLNVDQAVRGAIRYLRENINTFGGDVAKGVAAYNAGPGNVQNAVARGGGNWQAFVPGETKQYLQIVQPSGTVAMPDQQPQGQNQGQPTQDPAKYIFNVMQARGQKELGKRYAGPVIGEADSARWGDPGWDCSSFVSAVFKDIGVQVTPFTDAMGSDRESRKLKPDEARPGDMVLYRGAGSGGNPAQVYSHVGIYLGNGQMIDASTVGGNGVAIRSVDPNAVDFRRPHKLDSTEGVQAVAQAVQTGQQVTGLTPQELAQAGSTSMVTQSGTTTSTSTSTSTGFAAQQLQKAEADWRYWEQWKADAQAKPASELSEFDKERLAYLDNPDHPEGHLARARDAYAAAQVMAQREADLNPQGGASGAQNAQAATNWVTGLGGYQNDVITNAINAAKASTDLLKTIFGTQYDRATLVKDIFVANNTATSNYLKDQVAVGALRTSDAVAIAQTFALQQAAEATRATEVTARAKLINDADFRNAERKLPPGTHYVPGLEPNGALAGAMQKIGLNFPGVGVTPTDWTKLDPRTSFADAEKTVKPVPDFEVSGVKAAAAQNAGITATAPTIMTQEGVGVPDAPDFSGIQIPQVTTDIVPGQGGIPSHAEMIDYILQRGTYAPAPPQQTSAPGATAAPAPVTASASTTPATAIPLPPNRDPNRGSVLTDGSGGQVGTGLTTQTSPVQAAKPQQQASGPDEAIERIKQRLREWGLPVAEAAARSMPGPVGVAANAVSAARRFIR